MIKISHRGNINGSNPEKENSVEYIYQALTSGFNVEVDVRMKNGNLYFGHDEPQYKIPDYFLEMFGERLWLHCKDFDSLYYLSTNSKKYNFFWHQNDDYTLTSKGYVWTCKTQDYFDRLVVVALDETSLKTVNQKVYGVCSDYILLIESPNQ